MFTITPTCPNTPEFKPLIDDPINEYYYDTETKQASLVLEEVIIEGKADAVAAASVIHYGFIQQHRADFTNITEGNTAFLESGRMFSKINPCDLGQIKKHFLDNKIPCRP